MVLPHGRRAGKPAGRIKSKTGRHSPQRLIGPGHPTSLPCILGPPYSTSKHGWLCSAFKPIIQGFYPSTSLCSGFWNHLTLKVIRGRLLRAKPNSFMASPIRIKTPEVRIRMRRTAANCVLREASVSLPGGIHGGGWEARNRCGLCSRVQAPWAVPGEAFPWLGLVIPAGPFCFHLSILYLVRWR